MNSINFITFCYLLVSVFGAPDSNLKTIAAYQKNIELRPMLNAKITNGMNAERDQFPYQVSIVWKFWITDSHICGGSIISNNVVLTAAHCIQSYGTHSLKAGILNRAENTAFTQTRSVSKIIKHFSLPGPSSIAPNDIAVIIISSPWIWTQSVQSISLPNPEETFYGKGLISGWGRIWGTSLLPNTLQYAEKILLIQNECASALTSILGNSNLLKDSMICSSGAFRVSACNGDSGGPLAQNGVLIGVVSWGISPCGVENAPSVFTRTASFIPWIRQYI